MKRSTRLLTTLTQGARLPRPVTRPASIISPSLSVAGPSRIPSRSYATETPLPPSSTQTTTPLSTPIESELESEQEESASYDPLNDPALAEEIMNAEAEAMMETVPGNVRFEGFEDDVEEIQRALCLHTSPDRPGQPIVVPLSSLASPTPTLAAPGNLTSKLSTDTFGLPTRKDILHRNVVWYLSTLRSGNQSTKSRSTVNYSGRKLRQQKGTGKARVGDASSGIRRGGAPIFALSPRDHAQLLPRKVRTLGVNTALSSKLSGGFLRIIQDLNEAQWQGTNEARRALCDAIAPSPEDSEILETTYRFGTPSDLSILFIHAPPSSNKDRRRLEAFYKVIGNIPGVDMVPTDEVTVWHILKYKWTVMETRAANVLQGVEYVDGQAEEVLLNEVVRETVKPVEQTA